MKNIIESVEIMLQKKKNLSLYSSKIGGYGFVPKALPFPVNSKGIPLFLLAQINFSEMPKSIFPEKGILSFYIDYSDLLLGINFENYMDNSGYKVIFTSDLNEEHYSISEQKEIYQTLNVKDLYSVVYPIYTELSMYPKINNSYISLDSINCTKKEVEGGIKIGGKPFFISCDPRECIFDSKENDILLLQIDFFINEDENWEISFGEFGIGYFFISEKD